VKKFTHLFFATLVAMGTQSTAVAQSNGIVVLGGDDLQQHGNFSGGQNRQGWLYMENVLRSMAPQIRRAGPFTVDIVALTASSNGGDGRALLSAATPNNMTVQYVDGAANVTQFFTNLANGSVNPKIIHIAGDEGSGGTDSAEEAALAANAQALNSFVASGGGIFSHSGQYTWLQALLPGVTTAPQCTSSSLTFTPAGLAFLPAVTVADIRAGPCHNSFVGDLGALQVLAQDGSGRRVIIGGVPPGGGGITGGGNNHSIPCFSGPVVTDQPVHFVFTSSLQAPVTWSMNPGNIGSGIQLAADGTLSGIPRNRGVYPYTVTATSGHTSEHQQCQLVVNPPAPPSPTLSFTTACPLSAGVTGTAYNQLVTTSGGTAPVTISVSAGSLPAGLILSGGVISGTPTGIGTSTFTLSATDSGAPAQTVTLGCSIAISAAATAPTITSACPASPITVGVPFHTDMTATGTGPITWSLPAGSLPTGLHLAPDGTISGVPHHAGTYNFTIRASNLSGVSNLVCSIVVNNPSAPPPSAPSITTACPLTSGTVNVAYSQSFTTTGGTAPFTYSVIAGALPAGLTLSASGVLSGTPTAAGGSSFTVQAADSGNPQQTASRPCSVTINAAAPPVTPPVITSACPASPLVTGTTVSTQFMATGDPTITWSVAAGALPVGLTLSSTGLLSGHVHNIATSNFTIRATNAGGVANLSCSITVVHHAPSAPSISACPAANGQATVAYSSAASAMGGIAPYSFSVASGALPAGLTLAANGTLSGTPTTAGTSNFTLQVSDSSNPAQTATRACSVAIAAAPSTPPPAVAPTITSACPATSLPVGSPYSFVATATGDPVITWTIASGALPPGLTLNHNTGQISGTPNHEGVYNYTLRASNGAGSANQACSTSVTHHGTPQGPAPVITTTCPLPDAVPGVPYNVTLTATGGTPPYTWSLVSGALPVPLTLSPAGVISGTPVPAQALTPFTVRVTGANGASSTFSCVILVPAGSETGETLLSRGEFQYGDGAKDGNVPVAFRLAEALPYDVTGRVYLIASRKFGTDNDIIAFTSGGREADFTIRAGDTLARFAVENFGVNVGDHSANLVLAVTVEGNGKAIVIDLNGTESVPDSSAK